MSITMDGYTCFAVVAVAMVAGSVALAAIKASVAKRQVELERQRALAIWKQQQ